MKRNFFKKIKKFFFWVEDKIFKIPGIKEYLYLRQLSKFLIAGGFVTIIDFSTYFLLTRLFSFWAKHFLWANFISMSVGAILSYFLNKKWVFKDKSKVLFSHYIKFWVSVGIGGLILYQVIFAFLTGSVGFYDILGKAIAAFLVVFLRFIVQKFWIFN